MAYLVRLFDSVENRFFTCKYLYYNLKQVKQLVKWDYPNCEIIRIEKLDRF